MYGNKYRVQASTGFVIKLADQKFVVSCLNVYLVDQSINNYKKFIESGRPVVLTSFGNVDLLPHVHRYMEEYSGEFNKAKVELEILNRFFTIMTRIDVNVDGVLARK